MRQDVPAWQALLLILAGVSAVVFGASGAHALRHVLDASQRQIWETGVDYHFWHALALALAVLAVPVGRAQRVSVIAFALGIALFSGSLYALALGAPRWTGFITPFGGVAFMLGWGALGWAVWPRRSRV